MNIVIERMTVNVTPSQEAPASLESFEAPMRGAPPRIGQPWPGQGGIYAGVMRGDDGDYHLIVAATECEAVAWGAQGEDEPGATHDRDGLANTQALLASKHQHPAAQWAAGVTDEGHSDFYLPSRGELRLCQVNVPEVFAKAWHWSSTQYSAHYAWTQGFGDGGQDDGGKGYEARARAVRRFLIT